MKKNLITLLFTAVFCLLTGTAAFAQQSMPPDEPIAGGYISRKADEADVKLAVKKGLALKAKQTKFKYKLDKVYKAESQVVAGMNYRVCMSIYVPKKGEANEAFYVNAVIFKSLKGTYEITTWEEVEGCTETPKQ